MTSGDLGLPEGLVQEINEELDLAELFVFNSTVEEFPTGCDRGKSLWFLVILPLVVAGFIYFQPAGNARSLQSLFIQIESSVFCHLKYHFANLANALSCPLCLLCLHSKFFLHF